MLYIDKVKLLLNNREHLTNQKFTFSHQLHRAMRRFHLYVLFTCFNCVLTLLQSDLQVRQNKLYYGIENKYYTNGPFEFILRKNDWFHFTIYSDGSRLEMRFGSKLESLWGPILVVPVESEEKVMFKTLIDQNSSKWPTDKWYATVDESTANVHKVKCFIPISATFGTYYFFVTDGREILFNSTKLNIKAIRQ